MSNYVPLPNLMFLEYFEMNVPICRANGIENIYENSGVINGCRYMLNRLANIREGEIITLDGSCGMVKYPWNRSSTLFIIDDVDYSIDDTPRLLQMIEDVEAGRPVEATRTILNKNVDVTVLFTQLFYLLAEFGQTRYCTVGQVEDATIVHAGTMRVRDSVGMLALEINADNIIQCIRIDDPDAGVLMRMVGEAINVVLAKIVDVRAIVNQGMIEWFGIAGSIPQYVDITDVICRFNHAGRWIAVTLNMARGFASGLSSRNFADVFIDDLSAATMSAEMRFRLLWTIWVNLIPVALMHGVFVANLKLDFEGVVLHPSWENMTNEPLNTEMFEEFRSDTLSDSVDLFAPDDDYFGEPDPEQASRTIENLNRLMASKPEVLAISEPIECPVDYCELGHGDLVVACNNGHVVGERAYREMCTTSLVDMYTELPACPICRNTKMTLQKLRLMR